MLKINGVPSIVSSMLMDVVYLLVKELKTVDSDVAVCCALMRPQYAEPPIFVTDEEWPRELQS